MRVKLLADGRAASGGATLVLHNERLADPLDSVTQALAEQTSQRKKPLEVHAEIARREFFGGLYTHPRIEWPLNGKVSFTPMIPAWNLLRCLQDGAKRFKRGQDVLRGITPTAEHATLIFDTFDTGVDVGDPQALWDAGQFSLRKAVGVQRNRTMRTRPMFVDWFSELVVEVDSNIYNLSDLKLHWEAAGTYCGLGEMRPVWGRFAGVILKEDAEIPGQKKATPRGRRKVTA